MPYYFQVGGIKLKAGVIGVGAMGRHHARIYSEIDGVELIGVADINEDVGKAVASEYGTEYFSDYHELLKQVDIASIAVPTSLHAEVALKAAENRVDMLIEKPIADSVENAERIINSCNKNGVKAMIGHIERFNPAVIKLRELIDTGVIGEVITISGRRIGPYSPRIRDVGIIIDLAVHEIDTFSYLFGNRAQEVYAIAGNSFHTKEDYASILLRFPKNRSGTIETNWLTPRKFRTLTVVGTNCVAQMDYIGQSLTLYNGDEIQNVDITREEPLKVEIRYFTECIRKGICPRPDGVDGTYVLGVAISAMKSYSEKKVIPLDFSC